MLTDVYSFGLPTMIVCLFLQPLLMVAVMHYCFRHAQFMGLQKSISSLVAYRALR